MKTVCQAFAKEGTVNSNLAKPSRRKTSSSRLFWVRGKAWSYEKACFTQGLWFGVAGTFGGKN